MAFYDFAKNQATRTGTILTAVAVLPARIGRGDGDEDSGLDAFIADVGYQIKNDSSRLGLVVSNMTPDVMHVKLITSQQVDGLDVEDRIVSVPSGNLVLIGAFTGAYENTNTVDSGAPPAVSSTNYIQLQFATDAAPAAGEDPDPITEGDLLVIPIVIPAG